MAAAVPAAGEPFVKLPFSFATRFLFRLFLPGLLLALAFWPLLDKTLALMRISIDTDVLLLLAATISGWLIVVLDPHVYMLFEGRRYWPRWLWRRFHEGEQSRLARLRLKRQSASNANDKARVNELDIEEYTFPLSENGTPQAVYPTRIGNIITEYEQYPDRKYGIDGVFYWYRLWINLDSDLRTEIDEHQAVVDGMIYVSFVLYLGGILFLAYSAV